MAAPLRDEAGVHWLWLRPPEGQILPPSSWKAVELIITGTAPSQKPSIPQLVAEVTSNEKEFLSGARQRLKMKYPSTFLPQGPSATSDKAEAGGHGKPGGGFLHDLVRLLSETCRKALDCFYMCSA